MKQLVIQVASAYLPTTYGIFKLLVYRSVDGEEHIALVAKNPSKNPVVRIHSQCLTGDTLLSKKCDCRQQLHKSMKLINKKGGVLIYLNQEGRGVGLGNKVKAYALQDKGLDTVEANEKLDLPADARDYKIAAQILHNLGIKEISLLTNNLAKVKQLEKYGIYIAKRIPIEVKVTKMNKLYLLAKKKKLGHILTIHE